MNTILNIHKRDKHWKIRLFRSFFSGLEHVYGTYDPKSGRSWQVKEPVTDKVALRHLTGKQPYGVYLLTGDRTRASVADFDQEDLVSPMDFVAVAKHYGLTVYTERSKSKGYHVWMFFQEHGVTAAKTRLVFHHILDEVGLPATEVFPKQDSIRPDSSSYGNFINAPLFGALVPKGRTVFLNSENGLHPYSNQWAFLENAQRISEQQLDDIIEINELRATNESAQARPMSLGTFKSSFALPPCARRMLEEGVADYQRVSCFRLAVHLRKVGLPFELVVATLCEWSKKNNPNNGKRIITHREIKAQTAAAFLKEYKGCGCEEPAIMPFCDSSCPVYKTVVKGEARRSHCCSTCK